MKNYKGTGSRTPKSATEARRSRKSRDYNERLPAYVHQAGEFSDDPEFKNPLAVMQRVKKHLSGGAPDTIGSIWDDLTREIEELTTSDEGRPRKPGDYALLLVGYGRSARPEMEKFYDKDLSDEMLAEAGFDERVAYTTMYRRFVELEGLVDLFRRAGDRLTRFAVSNEPRILDDVYSDATAIHSRARLHHACLDEERCAELRKKGYTAKAVLDAASENQIRDGRKAGASLDLDEDDPIHPDALPDAVDQSGPYARYVMVNGHRYGVIDPDVGTRSYREKGDRKHKFWVGLLGKRCVSGFGGGLTLGQIVFPADQHEFNHYQALMERTRDALGDWPEVSATDKDDAIYKNILFNTERGIASVMPFREANTLRLADMRRADIDEFFIPRCDYCGGPGTQIGARLGIRTDKRTGHTALYFRCDAPHTDECRIKVQHRNLPREAVKGNPDNVLIRMLLPLSPQTERYHAIAAAQRNFERTFAEARRRGSDLGNTEAGKIKRLGILVHELRGEITRIVEWLFFCLRMGWIAGHSRVVAGQVLYRRGEAGLYRWLLDRRWQGVNLPYGAQT